MEKGFQRISIQQDTFISFFYVTVCIELYKCIHWFVMTQTSQSQSSQHKQQLKQQLKNSS